MTITVDVPVTLVSEANDRTHWSVRHRRRKEQRQAVAVAWKVAGVRVPVFRRAHVTLTRLCPSRNRSKDSDNLAASMKAIRDEVAALLGIDDADIAKGGVQWEYRQLPNQKHMVKVQVTLSSPLDL